MAETEKPQPKPILKEEMARKLMIEMQGVVQGMITRYGNASREIMGDDFALLLGGASAGLMPLASYECALAYRRVRADQGKPMDAGEEVELRIEGDQVLFAALAAAAAVLISDIRREGKEPPYPHPLLWAVEMFKSTHLGWVPAWMQTRVEHAERYEQILREAEAMGRGQTQGNA